MKLPLMYILLLITQISYAGLYKEVISRLKLATIESVKDTATWLPVALAGSLHLTKLDRSISKWAFSKNPIFGSSKNAMLVGDMVMITLGVGNGINTLCSPYDGDGGMDWLQQKGLSLLSSEAAIQVGMYFGNGHLAKAIGRQSPDKSEDGSLPSGHAIVESVYSNYIVNNVDYLEYSKAIKVTTYTLKGVEGWTRVESGEHYPTDVLLGMALGNFIGNFFRVLLFYDKKVNVTVNPYNKQLNVGLNVGV